MRRQRRRPIVRKGPTPTRYKTTRIRNRRPTRPPPPLRKPARTPIPKRHILKMLRVRCRRFARAGAKALPQAIVRDARGDKSRTGGHGGKALRSLWRAASLACASGYRDGPPAANRTRPSRDTARRFVRQTETALRDAGAEATRPIIRPTRPLASSRAALWEWYRRRGLSWARFVADHGGPT